MIKTQRVAPEKGEAKGLPVKGYTDQPNRNVELVNNNKEIEERLLRVLDALAEVPTVDKRWLAEGRVDIEKGFMAINRAVFQPTRVKLPEDSAGEAKASEPRAKKKRIQPID